MLSPVCVAGDTAPKPYFIGEYPLLTEAESFQALDAAVAAYNHGRGLWPTLSVAERIDHLDHKDRPLTECLKDTVERFLPYWHKVIVPLIRTGKRVIISAHGNSIRALVKYLDGISDEDIAGLNIPTGIPLIYELDESLKPIKNYYLGDPDEIKRATETVSRQGKA